MPSKILTGSILFLVSISAMAQDFLIGNEEIKKNGMPMVARSISGSMAGMSGTVTINLVKLSNGSYLYETTNQNDEAIEFNKRLCEIYGDKHPESPGKMVIGSDERNIPLHCEPASPQKEMSFKQQSDYYYMPGGQWNYRPVLSLSYDPYPLAGSYTRVSASAGVDFSVPKGGDLSLAGGVRGISNCYNNGFTMAGSIPVANLQVAVLCYMYPHLAGTGGKAVSARAVSESKYSASENGIMKIY